MIECWQLRGKKCLCDFLFLTSLLICCVVFWTIIIMKMVPCLILVWSYLKFLIMESWAILSGLNAKVLNFLEALKAVEQNWNDIPKSTLICKGCLSKFILCYLAYSVAVYSLCFYSRIPSTFIGDILGDTFKTIKIHKYVRC